MKETQLVKQVIQYLNMKGHLVWRNNSGKIPIDGFGKLRLISLAPAGSPDIVGLTKNGVFLGVECKIKGNKPTELQTAFLGQIKKRGGVAILAYDLDDIIRAGL